MLMHGVRCVFHPFDCISQHLSINHDMQLILMQPDTGLCKSVILVEPCASCSICPRDHHRQRYSPFLTTIVMSGRSLQGYM